MFSTHLFFDIAIQITELSFYNLACSTYIQGPGVFIILFTIVTIVTHAMQLTEK